MSSDDMMEALRALATEKGISPETLMGALADALESAYKRLPDAYEYAWATIDPVTGEMRVTAQELSEDGEPFGPELDVHAAFDTPGVYQLWGQFRLRDGDVVTDFDGVCVVVDRMSVPYLNGATIDFVDSIEKQGFTIDNPNAGGSCACGDSFH